MRDQVQLENPYREDDDDGDENDDLDTAVPGYLGLQDNYTVGQRSRSATGESGPLMGDLDSRVPPPRFPMGYTSQPSLTLRTQQLQGAAGTPQADSYFSPAAESPISSRTSSSSAGMFPFPRQQPPLNGWHGEDHNARFTAPAMARQMSRDGSMGPGVYPGGRSNAMQRPSLPPNAGSQHNVVLSQNRLRSASSPDIHNPPGPGRRPNGQHPPVPELPPFPTHYAYTPGIVNRSQNNSPNSLPQRAATQSPNYQRERLVQQRNGLEHNGVEYPGGPARHDPRHVPMPRTTTPGSSFDRTMSPPLPSQTHRPEDIPIPSQLKVKVHCPSAGSTMTLVVSTNISFQSLKDRIDAKLQRSTSVSLSAGQVKLKYIDEDDYVSIQSDEDVQTAFETWKEQQRDQIMAGQLGEIELYCQR